MKVTILAILAFVVGVWVGPSFPNLLSLAKWPALPEPAAATSSRYRLTPIRDSSSMGAWVFDTHTGEIRLWVIGEGGVTRLVLPLEGRAWIDDPLGEKVVAVP